MPRIRGTVWSVVKAAIFAVGVAFVFYKNILGLIPGAIVGVYVYRVELKRVERKWRNQFLVQFGSLLTAMQSALEAGNTIENSLFIAGKEMGDLYGDNSEIVKQIRLVKRTMDLNMPLEQAMSGFAKKYSIREVYDFVEVISTIKKTGGNAIRIISETVTRLVEGIELNAELEVMVASKKFEQQIMTFMPALIILFLRISSVGFLSPLYGNVVGGLLMTLILGGNVFADYLGKKIVEINI